MSAHNPGYACPRATIEQAIARGDTAERICTALGVSPARVDAVLRRMDAAVHGPPTEPEPALDEAFVQRLIDGSARPAHHLDHRAERVEAIRRLALQGWTDRQISRGMGVSHASVSRARRAHGIPNGASQVPAWAQTAHSGDAS